MAIAFFLWVRTRVAVAGRQGPRRGAAGRPRRVDVSGRRRRLLPRHGRRRAADARRRSRAATCGSSGPAATIASGTSIGVTAFGALDFLKTISSHPSLKASRDNRWEYLGLVNEPCFEKPTGPDPKRFGLWLDQRSRRLPARSVRERAEVSGRRDRRARQDGASRARTTASHRHRRPAAVSESGLRRGGRARRGTRSATTPIPAYYNVEQAGPAVPRRHVVRVLPRRPEPDQAAGRSGEPEVGEPQLERRRAVLLGRPHLRLGRRPDRTSSSSCSTPRGPGSLDTSLSPPTTSTTRAR